MGNRVDSTEEILEPEKLEEAMDGLDDEILERLAKRRSLVRELLRSEARTPSRAMDRLRHDPAVERLADKAAACGLDRHFVERFFGELLADSHRLQAETLLDEGSENPATAARVAFYGSPGSNSDLASQQYFGARTGEVVYEGMPGLHEVARAVASGHSDFGVVPIENTTAGSIHETYDLLRDSELSIVGEVVSTIEHCLLGLPGARLAEIRHVESHPQALLQCGRFLHDLSHVARVPAIDTAAAARSVRERGDRTWAAIATRRAAELHSLAILQDRIADQAENYTRFVVLGRRPIRVDGRIACRTSLLLATRHEQGALARVLNLFAAHELNLTKLESRPQPNAPWEYLFYLDLEGNIAAPEVADALEEVASRLSFFKLLGSYPQADRRGARAKLKQPTIVARSPATERTPGEGPGATPLPKGPKPGGSYKLASREARAESTVVNVGNVIVGSDEGFCVIAGPCSVESRDQIFTAARVVKEAGAHMLRGGCFKPRTSPYSFQGLEWEGLELLCAAGRAYDLPVVTEVLAEAYVQRVAEHADMLQVGARNMQNFSLLKEVGRVNKPVLLKRGMMASISELLNAAEYILAGGNQDVILCERGIRTFETATRNTLDITAVPALRERTHLPVIVDPSHACGIPHYVAPLARAAAAVGAGGIMVEVHANPREALSDKDQALLPTEFASLMEDLATLSQGRRPPTPVPRAPDALAS